MLLRALFSIGVVAALLPREPDIGYGPPGDRDGLVAVIRDTVQSNVARVGREIRDARGGRGEQGGAPSLLAQGRRIVDVLGGEAGDTLIELAADARAHGRSRRDESVEGGIGKINMRRAEDPLP